MRKFKFYFEGKEIKIVKQYTYVGCYILDQFPFRISIEIQ